MNTTIIKQLLPGFMALCLGASALADTCHAGGRGQTCTSDPAGNLTGLLSTPPGTSNDTLAVRLSGGGSGTPSAPGIHCCATSKGYGVLSVFNPGEGYWVNAKTPAAPTTSTARPTWTLSSAARRWAMGLGFG